MNRWVIGGVAGLAVLGASNLVAADEAPGVRPMGPAPDVQSVTDLKADPMGEADLGAISAGQGVVVEALSNQQLSASNSGSVEANQVATGNVDFSTGDYSGIGNFVVNTGNNNNLQGVISVNIATLGDP